MKRKTLQSEENFIDTASHELKTPITTIKGLTQILQKQVSTSKQKDNQKFLSYLSTISNQTDRLSRLVSYISEISKIKSGNLVLKLELVNIIELVEECIKNTKSNAKIPLSKPKEKSVIIEADIEILKRVITNILKNPNSIVKLLKSTQFVILKIDYNAEPLAGLTLQNSSDIIKLHKGSFSLSYSNETTSIKITLPRKKIDK